MDLRVDGYLSQTFGSEGAEQYFTRLLRGFNSRLLQPISSQEWPGAFFITTPAVQNAPHSIQINGQPAWLLDYHMRHIGTVVPQFIWRPVNPSDAQRYANSSLNMPIFFVHHNRVTLGLHLIMAAAGDCTTLLGAGNAAPVGDCSTTYVRIKWPGYDDWSKQIMTRDQTSAHSTITLEKLAKRVANAVCHFLDVGANGIKKNHVILIGLVHVSQGSWQPILQLDRYNITRSPYVPDFSRAPNEQSASYPRMLA
ncbi:hypothetical protein BJV78DRAFT_1369259 [Lactifluus subvellereus]|nr:hypothetical protein BJV78DRAFT_1369259 [Lactifluus subvellereus]